MEYEELT